MKLPALIALLLGFAAFVAVLTLEGVSPVVQAFAVAGWGIAAVIAVHLVPLVLDGLAVGVLMRPSPGFGTTLLARWLSESVNGLLPVAQMGGPLAAVRIFARAGAQSTEAAAAVTVATTLQMISQALFGTLGLTLLLAHKASVGQVWLLVGGTALFALSATWFQRLQQHGLFARLATWLRRLAPGRAWLDLTGGARALDASVQAAYGHRRAVALSFALNLGGWLVGTAEVWVALQVLGHPVGWVSALLLESLGQAIRGIAFAIPGALGAQEGGLLLLGGMVGLPPHTALALSLCKRARELALGLPGLGVWQYLETRALRRGVAVPSVANRPAN